MKILIASKNHKTYSRKNEDAKTLRLRGFSQYLNAIIREFFEKTPKYDKVILGHKLEFFLEEGGGGGGG